MNTEEQEGHLSAGTLRRFVVIAVLIAGALLAGVPAAAQQAENAAESQAPAGAPAVPPAGFSPVWKPIFKGIDAAEAGLSMPPLAVYAVRVDLRAHGISFLVTPSNGARPRETDGQKVSDFLEQYQAQAAINASPFSPVDEVENGPRDIAGLSVSRGDAYSAASSRYAALVITKRNRVWFVKPPARAKDAYNAAGGYLMILEGGRNTGSLAPRHPRSVAGLSKNGRYLYLVAIDGRQEGYSVGATQQEAAEWAHALGAFDALNLDGGGSTALAVADASGGARLLNRPIHNYIPGNERINGNNLAVFAEPLAR